MKKKYELMVIVNSRITNSEIEKRLKELRELLEEVTFEEVWGVRPFAYPIKGHEQGYYAVWNFMMDAEAVQDLEKTLKLFPDLVRFLILQVPQDYKPMSIKEIDAGLEQLRKEKSEKRGGMKSMGDKKKEEPRKPAPELKKDSASVPASEAPASKKEDAPTEEKKPKKSFDQKLEDILSNDDLGL